MKSEDEKYYLSQYGPLKQELDWVQDKVKHLDTHNLFRHSLKLQSTITTSQKIKVQSQEKMLPKYNKLVKERTGFLSCCFRCAFSEKLDRTFNRLNMNYISQFGDLGLGNCFHK